MQFQNHTPHAAHFGFGGVAPEYHGAWVIARTTLRVDAAGALAPDDDAPAPILKTPLVTDAGSFPPDVYAIHRGCEVVVCGDALPPVAARRFAVSVRAGEFHRELAVYGERVWRKTLGGALVPSEPEPFRAMPLGWSRAYGGVADGPDGPAPFALNPEGRGYYTDARAAQDHALANLEDPAAPVTAWDARPAPVAWGPTLHAVTFQASAWLAARGARTTASLAPDELTALALECVPCAASPRMVAPALHPGDRVSIAGMGDPLRFEVPDLALTAAVQLGGERFAVPLTCSGLWVFVPARRVVLTLRARFGYPVARGEARVATLTAAA